MGNGMNKIITGVYVGNFRDAKDLQQLKANNITHILAIHDYAKALHEDKTYLCINASDTPDQPLTQYFSQCIDFIHKARLDQGCVLIHCLAGVSRSVTVTAAYIMTVTNLGWREAINAIRGARSMANPNFGFQKQLQVYENEGLTKARIEFKEKYPDCGFNDQKECEALLKCFNHYLMTGESRRPPELYNLPHRAYGDRNKTKSDSTEEQGKLESDKKDTDDTQTESKDVNNETNDKQTNNCDKTGAENCDNKGVTNAVFNADDENS